MYNKNRAPLQIHFLSLCVVAHQIFPLHIKHIRRQNLVFTPSSLSDYG